MNLASSNINQWTMLAGMIPVVYSFSRGEVSVIVFDAMQRHEIMLTILQSLLGWCSSSTGGTRSWRRPTCSRSIGASA